MTEWKQVKGYEGHYEVSDQGQVRSVKGKEPKIMSIFPNFKGYMRITITKEGKMKQVFVHRLVAEAFIGDVGELTVNHKDGNKANNELSNLEIVSQSENTLHACYELGHNIKAVEQLCLYTGEVIQSFQSLTRAAKETGTSLESIVKVCRGQRNKAGGYKWRYLKSVSGGY